MKEQKNDGGPAFAQPMATFTDGTMYCSSEKGKEFAGMSLRDWFAGMCLEGQYSSDTEDWNNNKAYEARAIHCYEMADAMIKARDK